MTPLETILSNIQNVKVIDESIDYSQYIPLNLSSTNEVLAKIEITNSTHFEKFNLLLKIIFLPEGSTMVYPLTINTAKSKFF